MRLKGLKRKEVPQLIVTMGGFRAVVKPGESRAVFVFDRADAIPEHNNLRANGLEHSQHIVWSMYREKGSFTEQSPELIDRVARILGLFPVVIVDFRTEILFKRSDWHDWYSARQLLTYEMKPDDREIESFSGRAEIPLELDTNTIVHLCCEGQLTIKNNSVTFEPSGKMIEKETKTKTSADEWALAEATLDFDQQVMRRMSETIGELPLKVSARPHPNTLLTDKDGKPMMVYESFAATGPIQGREIIRWILRAALYCGVIFSMADLAEYDITLPSTTPKTEK